MTFLFDPNEYLERIDLTEAPGKSETGLTVLHRAQAFKLPFENLDIQLGRGIQVTPDAIYNKTVKHQRGGYCFELNGLFLMALQALGFTARALLARVHISGKPGGRTHQLSLVSINGQEYLADVGFGAASLRLPIPFETDRISDQDGQPYRLIEAEPWGYMMQAESEGQWQNLYSFDLCHVCPGDIETGNYFTSTSRATFFTQMRTANLPNPEGRLSLADLTLTEVRNGVVSQSTVAEGNDYLALLRERFGIHLDVGYEDLQPLRR